MENRILKRLVSTVSIIAVSSVLAVSTCGTLVNAESVPTSTTKGYQSNLLKYDSKYQNLIKSKNVDELVKSSLKLPLIAESAGASLTASLAADSTATTNTNTSQDGTPDPDAYTTVQDTLTTTTTAKYYTFTLSNDQATAFELDSTNSNYIMAIYDISDNDTLIGYVTGTDLNSVKYDPKLLAGTYEAVVTSTGTFGDSYTFGVNISNPGDNTSYMVSSNIEHVGLICKNGDIYSDGVVVFDGNNGASLTWNDLYDREWSDGSVVRKQIVDEVKVNTSFPVYAASYSTNAYDGGQETYSSPDVILIPLDAGTDYMYYYSTYEDNELYDTFEDVSGQNTPRLLTDTDLVSDNFRVTYNSETVIMPVALAYDMDTGKVFDFYSTLNYYYATGKATASVQIKG